MSGPPIAPGGGPAGGLVAGAAFWLANYLFQGGYNAERDPDWRLTDALGMTRARDRHAPPGAPNVPLARPPALNPGIGGAQVARHYVHPVLQHRADNDRAPAPILHLHAPPARPPPPPPPPPPANGGMDLDEAGDWVEFAVNQYGGGGGAPPPPPPGPGALILDDDPIPQNQNIGVLQVVPADSFDIPREFSSMPFTQRKKKRSSIRSTSVPRQIARSDAEIKTIERYRVWNWSIMGLNSADVTTSVIAGNTVTGQTAGWSCNFSSTYCTDIATFAALYDEYRIPKMEMTFMPSYISDGNPPPGAAPGLLCCPSLPVYVFRDYDDDNVTSAPYNTVSGAVAEALRNGPLMFGSGDGRIHKYSVVPRVITGLTTSAGATVAAGLQSAPWVRTATTTAQHYAIKAVADCTANSAAHAAPLAARLAHFVVLQKVIYQFRRKH